MNKDSVDYVLNTAQRYLSDKHPGGATLTVVPSGAVHRESWWYIDVIPDKEPARRFEYYEALADAENEIEEQEDLTVFFQPVPVAESEIAKTSQSTEMH